MPAWIIPAAFAIGQAIIGGLAARKQNKENRKFAEYQNLVNQQQLQSQLDYNTPKSQMARFQEAGLNPNLIYGQGNPGNQSAPLSYPDVKPADFQQVGAQSMPLLNQSLMTQSQVQAIDAKTRHTYALTELTNLQSRVMEKNPLLDEAGFKAIIDSLKSAAEIKGSDATLKGIEAGFMKKSYRGDDGRGGYFQGSIGEMKLWKDLDLLDQKFNLGALDAKIKAEVVTSKEFQNTLLEIQKRWMADGEITPQHILQFIQLFLMKMF